MSTLSKDWITEESQFEGHGMAQSFQVTEKVLDVTSKYQHLEVYKTKHFGHLMILDGVFQNTEVDEFAYHEMQSHVPMFAHPNPKRVLIVGGGDGGVAREILKHKCVEELHLVDIDEEVTKAARKFFPKIAAALDDSRLQIHHEDGAQYIKKYKNYFDVICIDSSDPVGPNQVLFRKPFYQDVYDALKEDGCAIAQGECPWLHPKTIKAVLELNREIFQKVDYYWHSIPVYPCGIMGLLSLVKGSAIASMSQIHPNRLSEAQALVDGGMTNYYTVELHAASFVKPAFFLRHETMLMNTSED